MRKRYPKLKIVLFVFAGLTATFCLWVRDSTAKARILHERSYTPEIKAYSALLPAGMTHAEVTATLQRAGLAFRERSEGNTKILLIDIESNPSPVWFCNFENIYAKVNFHAPLTDRIPDQATVENIAEYRQFMQCL